MATSRNYKNYPPPISNNWPTMNNNSDNSGSDDSDSEQPAATPPANSTHHSLTQLSPNRRKQQQTDSVAMLDTWLAELDTLTVEMDAKPVDPFRFSQATLEDTQEDELNAILGELSALQLSLDREMKQTVEGTSRTSGRTDSPDNDSGFSDNASLLSSRSSLSASGSSSGSSTATGANCRLNLINKPISGTQQQHVTNSNNLRNGQTSNLANLGTNGSSVLHANELAAILSAKIDSDPISFPDEKAEKIRIALAKMRAASVTRLYVKAFSPDGSSKALMVEESMSCGRVLSLLADKNHVPLSHKWALVEHLPHLHMERIYEDHELMVENLLMWSRDSKNKIYFVEREDKYDLFNNPQKYFLGPKNSSQQLDDHGKRGLIEEFLHHGSGIPEVESSLYLKAEGKKVWKKFTFVLRASGIYYYPKGRSIKDLVCLATIDHNQQIYEGVGGWRKKFKSPTEYGFVLKPARLQAKSHRHIKYLCAEDEETLRYWMVGLRIAKNPKTLWENFQSLQEEIAHEDLDRFGRSVSLDSMPIVSINTSVPPNTNSRKYSSASIQSQGSLRGIPEISSPSPPTIQMPLTITREEIGFESDSPIGGTIKRKQSTVLTPKIPLTLNTRSLVSEYITPGEGNVVTLSHTLQRKKSAGNCSGVGNSSNAGTLTKKSSITTSLPVQPSKAEEFEQVETDETFDLPPPPPELLIDSGDELSICENFTSHLPPPPAPAPNLKPKKAVTFAPAPSSQSQDSSSPKRLEDPPVHFLTDLQRVMQKKWQVAQKCQLEPTTSPQEILGFRCPSLSSTTASDEDAGTVQQQPNPAALNNVRAWVSQHYGGAEEPSSIISSPTKPIPPAKPRVSAAVVPPPVPSVQAPIPPQNQPIYASHYTAPIKQQQQPVYQQPQNVIIYENFESKRSQGPPPPQPIYDVQLRNKKPPPPIPKRADSTHLSANFEYNYKIHDYDTRLRLSTIKNVQLN